jgi:hypothetical protein
LGPRRPGRERVVLGDDLGLLLAEERADRPVPADEARFPTLADDGARYRPHTGVMSANPLPHTASAPSSPSSGPSGASKVVRLRLRPATRRALLTVHIIAGVGLLGDVAAVLAINVRAATSDDPALAAASYELLAMFTVLFGIPLSFAALGSGILLGLSSVWGVVRHAWVAAKLALLIGVILVGALVLGPGTEAMRVGDGGAEARLIAGSAYDVVALTLATGLSVFKPRRRRRGVRR